MNMAMTMQDRASRLPALRRRAIFTLAVSQMVGWGTTLYLPSIIGSRMGADLGLSSETVFGGISLMLVSGAFAAPRIGEAHDRFGAWKLMIAGSFVLALALVILGLSQGLTSYAAAWALIGLAMPMVLATGAYTAITQIDAAGARRIITIMTFFTGVTSTIFWPLIAWLEHLVGWRDTCLIFAASHIVICLPLHYFVLPRRQTYEHATLDEPDELARGVVPQDRRAASQLLLMFVFACQSFVSWGLIVHMIDMLKGVGLPAAIAVTVASIKGPCQVSARVGEMVFGSRYPATRTGLVAIALLGVAIAPLLVFTDGSIVAAICFSVAYGISDGLMTLARPAIPLGLYGREGYGAIVGRLSRPQNLVSAAAPIVYAAMIARLGVVPTLWLSLAGALLALAGMIALLRMVSPSRSNTKKNVIISLANKS